MAWKRNANVKATSKPFDFARERRRWQLQYRNRKKKKARVFPEGVNVYLIWMEDGRKHAANQRVTAEEVVNAVGKMMLVLVVQGLVVSDIAELFLPGGPFHSRHHGDQEIRRVTS